MLTPKQKQVLDYIKSYNKKKGISPSLEEIRKQAHVASVSTAHYYVKKLQSNGYLKKEEHYPRAIDVYENEHMIQIPLLGIIAAGHPIEAIKNKETIAVSQARLPLSATQNIFALKVSGDSMVDENINDGDIVLVKEQRVAENGQKVVALIDNSEATLKTFYKERNGVRLEPANKKFESIRIKNGEREFAIQGIVLNVVKETVYELPPLFKKKTSKKRVTQSSTKMTLNKIVCGDALIELKNLPSNSIDIVIADPPYNIGKNFGNNHDRRELSDYITWSKQWIDECFRVLKPAGTMFIYGFSEILAHISVRYPLEKQRWLIWHYTNKNVASYHFWQRSHEAILCLWKEKPMFNRDLVREPYTEGFLRGAAGKVRKGTNGRFSKSGKETVYNAHENGALPRDVLKIPALAGGAGMTERWFVCKTCNDVFEPQKLTEHNKHEVVKHPTQKPLELSQKLILSAMPKKDGVILVPFVGTGSECATAKRLGQSYIGFEINPDYIKLAKKFVESVT